jgi:hypothetical protein
MNMALPVMITGRSGSGKTFSLKNFTAEEISVISIEKGRLPFRSDIKVIKIPKSFASMDQNANYATLNSAKYAWVMNAIKSAPTKSVCIDDSQYLLANELFDRAYEKGYDKYTQMAVNFRNLIHFVNDLEQDDKVVYFLHHSEPDTDGREKVKTIGKMLDEKLTVEGCFDIVLYCQDHKFFTQSNGLSTAKSPEGMFDLEIPNDLKAVDVAIREYYGMGDNSND